MRIELGISCFLEGKGGDWIEIGFFSLGLDFSRFQDFRMSFH